MYSKTDQINIFLPKTYLSGIKSVGISQSSMKGLNLNKILVSLMNMARIVKDEASFCTTVHRMYLHKHIDFL